MARRSALEKAIKKAQKQGRRTAKAGAKVAKRTAKAATKAGTKLKKSLLKQLGIKVYKKSKYDTKNKQWIYASQVRIPQRRMLPEGEWGPIWSDTVERTAEQVFDKYARGKLK